MNTQINLTATPQEFFKERIDLAGRELKIQLPDDVEFYIVNLLCSFICPPSNELTLDSRGRFFNRPLAFMLKDAVEAEACDKPGLYKALGDTSLYITGFFQDYFNGKCIDIDYYIALGKAGYENAAVYSNGSPIESSSTATYKSLAENFIQVIDLVAEVAELGQTREAKDILNIYDRWTKSNSDRLRRILERQGIEPIMSPRKRAQ